MDASTLSRTLSHLTCGCPQVIYSVLVDRPFSFAFFSSLADTGRYDVEPITGFDALGMEEVCMHKITLKPGAESLCACV